MGEIKGIYAASVSILDSKFALNVDKTILHAENLINSGCHGVVIFGSTGQAQLLSIGEKIQLINKLQKNKYKEKFIIGTGLNSLSDNINFMKICMTYNFKKFLIMPPAYYNYGDDEVEEFYTQIIYNLNECKIILYNFEKLCGYKFNEDFVKKLVNKFPKQIIGVKDSSYNLYKSLKIKNFSILPGSEIKLISGLKNGCTGIISATCNITSRLAREVYDSYLIKSSKEKNVQLCKIREVFDQFNLISGVHSVLSNLDNDYNYLLPTLKNLDGKNKKKLISQLEKLEFNLNNLKAA